eukprot:PhM_4_TR9211/c1_g1_i1/m.106004
MMTDERVTTYQTQIDSLTEALSSASASLAADSCADLLLQRAAYTYEFARYLCTHPADASEVRPIYALDSRTMCELAMQDITEAVSITNGALQRNPAVLKLRAKVSFVGLRHCARSHILTALSANRNDEELLEMLAEVTPSVPSAVQSQQQQQQERPTEFALDDDTCRSHFECVLCCRLFREPVTTSCGHTFCRECLLTAMDHSQRCPCCRTPLHVDVRNHPLNVVIAAFLEAAFPNAPSSSANSAQQQTTSSDEEEGSVASAPKTFQLPLFVLGVMFPHITIQLNVFEPRYRLMIRRCLEGSRVFGVTSPSMTSGTVCRILHSQVQPDGRIHITITGERRFKVESVSELDGYKVATATPLVDDPETLQNVTSAQRAWIISYLRRLGQMAPCEAVTAEIEANIARLDDTGLSLMLCGFLPFLRSDDASHAEELLMMTNVVERVQKLRRLEIAHHDARRRATAAVAERTMTPSSPAVSVSSSTD